MRRAPRNDSYRVGQQSDGADCSAPFLLIKLPFRLGFGVLRPAPALPMRPLLLLGRGTVGLLMASVRTTHRPIARLVTGMRLRCGPLLARLLWRGLRIALLSIAPLLIAPALTAAMLIAGSVVASLLIMTALSTALSIARLLIAALLIAGGVITLLLVAPLLITGDVIAPVLIARMFIA